MVKLNCLIYDDDRLLCEDLQKMLIQEENSEICLNVKYETNRQDALRQMNSEVSAVFLDIQLEQNCSGIEISKEIRRQYSDVPIIFCTSYIRYCQDIYEVSPFAFLVKPIDQTRLHRVVQRLAQEKKNSRNDTLTVMLSQSSAVHIDLKEIAYIEVSERKLHLMDAENNVRQVLSMKLSDLEKKMPYFFVRCHCSFMVNMNYVTQLKRYFFQMRSGKIISISQIKFLNVREQYLHFLQQYL